MARLTLLEMNNIEKACGRVAAPSHKLFYAHRIYALQFLERVGFPWYLVRPWPGIMKKYEKLMKNYEKPMKKLTISELLVARSKFHWNSIKFLLKMDDFGAPGGQVYFKFY